MHTLKPAKYYKTPLYPNKEEANIDASLLKKLPDRWINSKKAAVAAGLIASMTVSLAACASDPVTTLPGGVPLPPEMVTESDAIATIKNISDGFFANTTEYDAKNIKKTLSYLRYDFMNKAFIPVVPADSEKIVKIDACDSIKGIGVEYISNELKTEGEAQEFSGSGEMPKHTNKQNAYILVMEEAFKDSEKENALIKEQVEAFISWLKSEGII